METSPDNPQPDNAMRVQELLDARKVLFVGAHPDDIEWYCGGLVHMLRKRDAEVVFAVATRGGKGTKGRMKRWLEGRRSSDQMEAVRILGGARVVFYDYPDKGLPQYVRPFAEDMGKLISKERPDYLFSWDWDYIYNPHVDHRAAAESVRLAVRETAASDFGLRVCCYGTREPNLWLGYGEDVFRVKLRSLRAHKTEVISTFFVLPRRVLNERTKGEGEKIGAGYAEVFRLEGD